MPDQEGFFRQVQGLRWHQLGSSQPGPVDSMLTMNVGELFTMTAISHCFNGEIWWVASKMSTFISVFISFQEVWVDQSSTLGKVWRYFLRMDWYCSPWLRYMNCTYDQSILTAGAQERLIDSLIPLEFLPVDHPGGYSSFPQKFLLHAGSSWEPIHGCHGFSLHHGRLSDHHEHVPWQYEDWDQRGIYCIKLHAVALGDPFWFSELRPLTRKHLTCICLIAFLIMYACV